MGRVFPSLDLKFEPEIIRRCLSPGALRLLEDGEREKCGRSILRIGFGKIIFRVE